MQSTKPSFFHSSSAFDSYPAFTAWEHNEQPTISLKQLNRHLSYLQNQYRTIAKEEQSDVAEQQSNIWRRKSQSKVGFFEENPVRFPEVKKYRKGKSITLLRKNNKQNMASKDSEKKQDNTVQLLGGEVRKVPQKRRSESEFSLIKDYLKVEVSQKDIFLHKNKISNISKTINLKTIKQESTYCFKQQSLFKPSRFGLLRKLDKALQVRS